MHRAWESNIMGCDEAKSNNLELGLKINMRSPRHSAVYSLPNIADTNAALW